jgi:type I restriction enzyme S subunit
MVMSDPPHGKALAKCFLVDQDDQYTLNQRIGAFSVKDENIISTKFLFYILDRNRQLLRFDNGADQTNLRKGEILSIKIPVPSKDEQARIVAILDKFDTLTHSISEGLPREIELRQKQYEYYRDVLLNFPKPEPQTEGVA